ncbi:MAG TPA: hypothetical protein VNT53_00640 [Pseudolysinimonas sp.]|nr:hypothetical protein [Pseudolysinimonas sp.]
MSDLISPPPGGNPAGIAIRPLSVRMDENTRAQLEIIAQLNDRSVTEEVRKAIEFWIEKSKSDPQVLKRAETVRAEIERDAATKRGAISAIFDGSDIRGKTAGQSRTNGKEGSS